MPQNTVIENDDRADEGFENENELKLRCQIGFACFVDKLGDFAHCPVNGQAIELHIEVQAKDETERADAHSTHKNGAAINTAELNRAEVGQFEITFAGPRGGWDTRDGEEHGEHGEKARIGQEAAPVSGVRARETNETHNVGVPPANSSPLSARARLRAWEIEGSEGLAARVMKEACFEGLRKREAGP